MSKYRREVIHGKETIVYHLIENPLREERVIKTNMHKFKLALARSKGEVGRLRKLVYTPDEEEGIKEKAQAYHRSLEQKYTNESKSLKGLSFLLVAVGFIISYKLYPFLFDLGFLPLRVYFVRTFQVFVPGFLERLPAHVIPTAIVVGVLMALLPLIVMIGISIKYYKKARKLDELVNSIRALGSSFEVKKDANLASFLEDNRKVIERIRADARRLKEAKTKQERLELCESIREMLGKLKSLTKFYRLDELTDYYYELERASYQLFKDLKRARYGSTENRLINTFFKMVNE